jgi:hypothetical protein
MNAPRSGCPINLTLEALGDRSGVAGDPVKHLRVLGKLGRKVRGRPAEPVEGTPPGSRSAMRIVAP